MKKVLRVVLIGSESTGKTTLCKALAELYGEPWVPEYGREYTLERYAKAGGATELGLGEEGPWTSDEFRHIAEVQQKLENEAAEKAKQVLFCDTNAFATAIWHERYMGFRDPETDAIAAKDQVDLYLVTGNDVPFEADEIRDGENLRHWMLERFLEEIKKLRIPYEMLTGSHEKRMQDAIEILRRYGVTLP